MVEGISDRIKVFFSFIRSFLGEVPPDLRGITIGMTDKKVEIHCIFNGVIKADDIDSMNTVEAGLLADLPEMEIVFSIERLDFPEPLNGKVLDEWLFLRRERIK